MSGSDQEETKDGFQQEQTFYPSYSQFESQPLGHSRPYVYQQEAAYSQRAVSPYQQQLSYDTYRGGDNFGNNQVSGSFGLLGSGNFGVIQGGTFYNDNEGESSNFEQQHFNSYYRNGHGRPSDYFGRNPVPRKQEQFANFRDFADINTPSYSEYVVVYANKNNTEPNKHHVKPKNIIEQLALLDLDTTTTTAEVPTKKLSKSKRKLASLLPEKKIKKKELLKNALTISTDLHEPLLALS